MSFKLSFNVLAKKYIFYKLVNEVFRQWDQKLLLLNGWLSVCCWTKQGEQTINFEFISSGKLKRFLREICHLDESTLFVFFRHFETSIPKIQKLFKQLFLLSKRSITCIEFKPQQSKLNDLSIPNALLKGSK